MTLPPGQHAIEGFPRFGTHLHRPPPAVPTDWEGDTGDATVLPHFGLLRKPMPQSMPHFAAPHNPH